jgi:hypothetical protein
MEIIIDGIVYVPKNKEVESVIVEQHFKFEVHPEELGEMTWEDAVKAVKELGSGWRLPTIEECFIMYRHKVITTASYWSSSEYGSNYAWYFSSSFYTGYAGINGKTTTYYVRAVKSI